MPFDKLKAPSVTEGLSLPAGRQGLILSGVPNPDLRIGSLAPSNVSKLVTVIQCQGTFMPQAGIKIYRLKD